MEQPEQPAASLLSGVLQRDQWIVLSSLAIVCVIAWWWLWTMQDSASLGDGMAGMEMSGMDMGAMAMPAKPQFATTFLMWFVMMVAMMLPSATPMILLYETFSAGARKAGRALMPTALFAFLYLLVWAAFSLVASAAQIMFSDIGVVDAASMAISSGRIAGALLIAAALYQLSPAKRACLARCRSPFDFLRREWGPGWGSAVRLGFKHGVYCLGCCWLIMALLFVGGVMNLAWVAVLALVVLVEKVAPAPDVTRLGLATAALLAGLYLLFR